MYSLSELYEDELDTFQEVNSSVLKKEHKQELFKQREIQCTFCRYHKGENGIGPRHGQDRYKDVRKGRI